VAPPQDDAGADEAPIAIATDAPAPVPDEESAPFWAGLAERRIVLQRCQACGRRRFPRMPACPYCGSVGGDDVDVAGTGEVYSFVRPERALTAAYAAVAPYAVATVELDGGGRVFGRVVPAEACRIGLRVVPAFVDHLGDRSVADGGSAWTELCFRPAP
jgi:uncharacterized OB-fold protein